MGHPVYPITINNLPWLDHTDGYGQNCDEMFRLMVDPDGPWDYTERDMALTSLKLECNDDETTTVTSELIRFDLLDESPSRWREMNRRTDVGAWPLYKMTPTLNEATFVQQKSFLRSLIKREVINRISDFTFLQYV